MADACPLPTPGETVFLEGLSRAEQALLETTLAALRDAQATAAAASAASGLDKPPPPFEYFVASLHQKLFAILCKADPITFQGGDPTVAAAIIRNGQNVAAHYWGADRASFAHAATDAPRD